MRLFLIFLGLLAPLGTPLFQIEDQFLEPAQGHPGTLDNSDQAEQKAGQFPDQLRGALLKLALLDALNEPLNLGDAMGHLLATT